MSLARPIKVLERELTADIDILLSKNFEKPSIAIALLYILTLNSSQNCIDKTLFEKLMVDYLLSDECIQIMKKNSFDPSKAY